MSIWELFTILLVIHNHSVLWRFRVRTLLETNTDHPKWGLENQFPGRVHVHDPFQESDYLLMMIYPVSALDQPLCASLRGCPAVKPVHQYPQGARRLLGRKASPKSDEWPFFGSQDGTVNKADPQHPGQAAARSVARPTRVLHHPQDLNLSFGRIGGGS